MTYSSGPNFPFSHPDDSGLPAEKVTWPKLDSQVGMVLLNEGGKDPESVEAIVCRVILDRSGLENK